MIISMLLLIPFLATLISDQVNWDVFDFLILGTILAALAIIYEIAINKSENTIYKVAVAIASIAMLLLFWVNGGVGIIGSEDQPANYLYGVVLLIILFGIPISKFKADKMAQTMFIAAGAQMLVPVVAYLIWPPPLTSWAPGVVGVYLMTAFFAMLFLVSGLLFRRARTTD